MRLSAFYATRSARYIDMIAPAGIAAAFVSVLGRASGAGPSGAAMVR
jgi:hypothetical protein